MSSPFRVLEAARAVVDEVNQLIDARGSRILYDRQLRAAAESIPANIREGYGRKPGAERNVFLRHARGSAEETDEHLHANMRSGRITQRAYWRLHNRIRVVVKMLDRLMT